MYRPAHVPQCPTDNMACSDRLWCLWCLTWAIPRSRPILHCGIPGSSAALTLLCVCVLVWKGCGVGWGGEGCGDGRRGRGTLSAGGDGCLDGCLKHALAGEDVPGIHRPSQHPNQHLPRLGNRDGLLYLRRGERPALLIPGCASSIWKPDHSRCTAAGRRRGAVMSRETGYRRSC